MSITNRKVTINNITYKYIKSENGCSDCVANKYILTSNELCKRLPSCAYGAFVISNPSKITNKQKPNTIIKDLLKRYKDEIDNDILKDLEQIEVLSRNWINKPKEKKHERDN